MAGYKYNMPEDINDNVVEFMAGERDRGLSYHLPETRRGLKEDGSTTINLAGLNTWGDMKETSKEISAAGYYDIKKLLKYIREERKALRDSLTPIKEAIIDDIRE
jgi:hypothetical protein